MKFTVHFNLSFSIGNVLDQLEIVKVIPTFKRMMQIFSQITSQGHYNCVFSQST